MANATSPLNTNTKDLDPLVASTGTSSLKRAVGPIAAAGIGDTIANTGVATDVDDAAFTPGTSSVVAIAGFADEAATDSVDEGDVGAVRMTLDRRLHVRADGLGTAGTPAGGVVTVQGVASGTVIPISQPGLSGGILQSVTTLPKSALTISGNTLTNPTVVTTETHGLTSGQTVTVSGSNSDPVINGARVVTVINATTFSVPVNVTTAGTAGAIVVPAQPVPASPLAGRATMLVQAPATNTATVYLGASTVTADAAATGGIALLPGESMPISLAAAVLLYGISASAAQRVVTLEVAA